MIISINRGTPIQTSIHQNPHYWGLKMVSLILTTNHFIPRVSSGPLISRSAEQRANKVIGFTFFPAGVCVDLVPKRW